MDADGLSVVDNRAGVTFGVELYVPWDAPEAVVDVSSAHVVPMRGVLDVIGLVGRRDSAVECRVLQGRDARSIQMLVPDCRGLDQNFQNFHGVSMPELSDLMHKWLPAVINHMMIASRTCHSEPGGRGGGGGGGEVSCFQFIDCFIEH